MRFPSGIEAVVSGDMRKGVAIRIDLKVTGNKGVMVVNNPITPQAGHSLQLDIEGNKVVETFDRRATYGYQLDAFIDAVEDGKPLLTGANDGVRQMRVIDRCYEAAGLPVRGLKL